MFFELVWYRFVGFLCVWCKHLFLLLLFLVFGSSGPNNAKKMRMKTFVLEHNK